MGGYRPSFVGVHSPEEVVMFFRLLLLFSLSLSIYGLTCIQGDYMEGFGFYVGNANNVKPGGSQSVVCTSALSPGDSHLCRVKYRYEREENGGREFQRTQFSCVKVANVDAEYINALSQCNRHSINRNSKQSPSKDRNALTHEDAKMINIGLEYVETGECYCNLDYCNDPQKGSTASVFSLLIIVFPFIYHFLE